MGDERLRQHALETYRVELTEEEVRTLTDAWFNRFPEMREFLRREVEDGDAAATVFELTPSSFWLATGKDWVLGRLDNDDCPFGMLGSMCLKALREPNPTTGNGRPYSAEEIAYFWGRVAAKERLFPKARRKQITERRASVELWKAARNVVTAASVFTLTGRLRANASFPARHNTVFQGLASDGAKLALWKLWRAGYRIANLIHDEVIVDLSAGCPLGFHAERIKHLMIDGMREVVPDVRIGVEYSASDRWSKDAGLVRDRTGKLLVWHPKGAKKLEASNAV